MPALQSIVAAAALQRVRAAVAADAVVAAASMDHVLASAANDDVVTLRSEQGLSSPAVPTIVAAFPKHLGFVARAATGHKQRLAIDNAVIAETAVRPETPGHHAPSDIRAACGGCTILPLHPMAWIGVERSSNHHDERSRSWQGSKLAPVCRIAALPNEHLHRGGLPPGDIGNNMGQVGRPATNTLPEVVASVLAFAAGAILTMFADTMMPEAFEHEGKLVGVMTTLGFAVAFMIHTLE